MEALQGMIGNAERLGKHRLITEIGRGGMANVYLAVAEGPAGFNRLVVLKRICAQLAGDAAFEAMFLDEARLAGRLRHPNVVQTHELGEDNGRYFIAMEYLDGQPMSRIRSRFMREGGLPFMMQLEVLIGVLAGLHYAHELTDYDGTPLSVVHRDFSPDNVFVTYDGAVKVVDFGIAIARDAHAETKAGVFMGKVAYMAPEQAVCSPLDRRADIFAVGVMLWEAATGTRLWQGLSRGAIVRKLLTGDIPSARDANPAICDRLDAILRKAMAPAREDRFATAAELQAELEALLADLGGAQDAPALGRLVAAHFEDERARIRGLIEAHLCAPQDAPARCSRPSCRSPEPRSSLLPMAPRPSLLPVDPRPSWPPVEPRSSWAPVDPRPSWPPVEPRSSWAPMAPRSLRASMAPRSSRVSPPAVRRSASSPFIPTELPSRGEGLRRGAVVAATLVSALALGASASLLASLLVWGGGLPSNAALARAFTPREWVEWAERSNASAKALGVAKLCVALDPEEARRLVAIPEAEVEVAPIEASIKDADHGFRIAQPPSLARPKLRRERMSAAALQIDVGTAARGGDASTTAPAPR
jgi:serine/threonine protein kinase